MFVGHLAVGFAGKRLAPRLSLATLFLSVEFPDVIWPVFTLLGWEHLRIAPGMTAVAPFDFYDYPISHSLLAVLGWSIGLALTYFALKRYARGAWVVGLGVLSHWMLDFVSHRPDMPVLLRGPYVGLGLWNSLLATVVVELALFGLGVLLYLRATRPKDGVGRYALAALVGFLLLAQAGSYLGPAPPSVRAVALGGLAAWLLIVWALWVDRHRVSRVSA